MVGCTNRPTGHFLKSDPQIPDKSLVGVWSGKSALLYGNGIWHHFASIKINADGTGIYCYTDDDYGVTRALKFIYNDQALLIENWFNQIIYEKNEQYITLVAPRDTFNLLKNKMYKDDDLVKTNDKCKYNFALADLLKAKID